jgi:hypothetical protein
MTYRQYYVKLIGDLSSSEDFNEDYFQNLTGRHDFSDSDGVEAYKNWQAEVRSTMTKCERLNELLSSNQVKPTDIVDPLILGFSPVAAVAENS